jgi:ketosteroid isomerase-like protein
LKEGTADLAMIYEPDAVIELQAGLLPDSDARIEGYEEIASFWRDWLGPWEDVVSEFDEVHEAGDIVLAVVTLTVRGRDGIAASVPYAQVATFRGVRVRHALVTRDLDAAFAAAGISR